VSAARAHLPSGARFGLPKPALPAAWIAAAIALGLILGLMVALQQTTYALGVVLLPCVVALFLRPEWLPPVLMVTVFGEALSTGSVTLSRIGGPLALVIMVFALPSRRRMRLPKTGLIVAVVFYSAWALASALWTVNPYSGLSQGGTGYALAALSLSVIYMLAFIMFVRTERDIRRLMWVTWLLSTITGMVSVAQYASGYSRAVGVSGDANFFAALQVVVLPIGALLAIEVRKTRSRVIILVGLAVAVGSIITSLSRGGILALAAVFVMLSFQPAKAFFRTPARKRAFMAFVVLGAGVLLIASFSSLSARASTIFNTADGGSGRTNLWRSAITGWEEQPVTGIGFGAFIGQSNRLLLRTPGVDFSQYDLRSTGQYVHNAYLETLTELGVIGAALFVAMLASMAYTLRATARRARSLGSPLLFAFTRALMLGFAGWAFTSIFLSAETDHTLYVLIGLTVALPRVLREEQARRGKVHDPTTASATVPWLAIPGRSGHIGKQVPNV
jgi:O-antigen ligase